jgi:hypothetical protein
MSFGKLYCRFNTLTAGAAKECLANPAARQRTQSLGQFTGSLRHMALQHRRTLPVQLVFYGANDCRVIMAEIVNAVTRKKVEYAAPFRGEELSSNTAFILNIHLQELQKPNPLRVYGARILLLGLAFRSISQDVILFFPSGEHELNSFFLVAAGARDWTQVFDVLLLSAGS